MIEILSGLAIGAISGIFLGFIPGMSMGFIFLALPNVNPLFAGGFVIGSDATSSMVKQLNILSPVSNAENVYLSQQLPSLLRKGEGIKAVMTSTMLYSLFKSLWCMVGIFMLATDTAQHINIGPELQIFMVAYVAICWYGVIWEKSENKGAALVIFVSGAVLGILTVKLSGTNNMFALTTSLFGVSGALQLVRNQQVTLPPQEPAEAVGPFQIYPVLGGMTSSLIWGIPTSLWLASTSDDLRKNDPLSSIKASAIAEGTSSALGLTLTLAVGASRSSSATYINNSLGSIDGWLAAGLLGLTVIFTIAMTQMMPALISIHMATIGCMNQKVLGYIIVVISIIAVIKSLGVIGLFVIGASLGIQKMIENSDAPQELSLSSMSAIPVASLFGFL